jgi:signal transduction histidine kinase/DNA-binding NarL/FixJ family response regulator
MYKLRDISIRTKLVLLAGTAVLCALAISSTGVIVKDAHLIREATISQLQVQARMMEFNSDGVLAFADATEAAKLLSSFAMQPAIEAACLLDADGKVLAQYARPGEALDLPTSLSPGVREFPDGHICLITPVTAGDESGDVLGMLYLRANTQNTDAHAAAILRYILLASAAALLVAVAMAAILQKAISRPIIRLTEAAHVITREGDYSIRVSRASQDELGTLYESFNQMLDALKSSHDQVAAQAQELAREVGVRKRAEAALLDAKEAAEASNLAKSQFLANMSHEIRTPLTGILGFTEVLLSGGDEGDPAKRRDYLATIQTSGQHLLGLINDILDLSKIESGRLQFEYEPCRIDQVVNDVMTVLQVNADEKSLELTCRWDTPVPRLVLTDATRVRQALINIVGNALKFTARGRVDVVGRYLENDGRAVIEFEVIDTGPGIATEAHERIFDPFVQADGSVTRRFGGTGLGLAISRRIARGLGGDLTVSSELGKGSSFCLRIGAGEVTGVPLMRPADVTRPRASRAASDQAPTLPPVNVLVVEDGDTNRKLIKLLLTRAGARVVAAENGELGVAAARQERFDVILMDMQMPVLDGYSATRRLRDDGCTLPIIALTANAMTSDRNKCLEAGCTDYLTKPIIPEQMFAAVRAALASEDVANDRAAAATADCERPTTGQTPPASPDIASSLPTDDPELAIIVAEYVDRLEAKLDEMKAAWDRGDLVELAKLAHWLKGSGGTAGFAVFNAPALHLENLAKGKAQGDVETAIEGLRSLHRRLIVPQTA